LTKKVLLIQKIHEAGLSLLEERNDIEISIASATDEQTLIAEARDAHAIIARAIPVTGAIVDAARELLVVSRHGVGYDNVDVERLTARGIPLTIAIDANALSVAEHTLYLILALAKRGFAFDRGVKSGNFAIRASLHGADIAEKNLLVVGFGRTGTRVARLARAFGMHVYVCDPYIAQSLIDSAECTPVDDYFSVLPDMDFVSLHCPLTDETRGMIGERALAAMRSSAYVINCARGGIVDEPALRAALVGGEIAGAGLDVFVREPTPGDDPLLTLENVITSPHIAGVTLEASMRMAMGSATNVLAAFDGVLDPAVVVNKEVLAATSAR
jgi:D-3-phosphoglycerate dehydrogenase / 2-oxoglutarate reductase